MNYIITNIIIFYYLFYHIMNYIYSNINYFIILYKFFNFYKISNNKIINKYLIMTLINFYKNKTTNNK